MCKINAKNRESPIIYRNEEELIKNFTKHGINIIRDRFHNESIRVAGVDATVLVKGVQVLHGYGVVVGLASPNQ